VSARIPVITNGLKNRLWAVIIITVSYLIYSSLADFIPRYWEQIGLPPLSRYILKIGMLLILLISLSGLAISDKMNSLIIRDGLTGLFNKTYVHQRLDEEFYRSKRYDHDLSLMMIDLDNFKALNDRFGHAVGDHLLRYFSQVIADTIRPSDIAARYGGEEFLIILPETRKEEAQTVAERLLNRISLYPFRVDSRKEDVPFTISIGVTAYPDHGESAEDLVVLADQALYQAKKDGKNKVAIFETVH
jgi:diguanylate cyclase (GGDEF)-like protein